MRQIKIRNFVVLEVESSVITRLAFHTKGWYLIIEFKNGTVGIYHKVPPFILRELKQSNSKGRYFNQNIRKEFEYKKVA